MQPHNTTRPPRRYTGPTARQLAALLPGSSRPDSHGRWRFRGLCHGHGDRPDSASLVLQDRPGGGFSVKCWAGCDRPTIIAALEQASGLQIWDAWEGAEPPGSGTGAENRPIPTVSDPSQTAHSPKTS